MVGWVVVGGYGWGGRVGGGEVGVGGVVGWLVGGVIRLSF